MGVILEANFTFAVACVKQKKQTNHVLTDLVVL